MERQEEARVKKMQWRTRFEVNTIVNELVNNVLARSAVERVLEEVVARSAWRVKLNRVWSMLVDDQPLQEAM